MSGQHVNLLHQKTTADDDDDDDDEGKLQIRKLRTVRRVNADYKFAGRRGDA